jgi:superfamily I DNA and/or RNA helicase
MWLTYLNFQGFPILFVNVGGSEFYEGGGTSPANQQEIEVVIKFIEKIDQDFYKDPAEIGIISPYTYQTRLIRKRIKDNGDRRYNKLTVDSVERFQGSERDAIITTATRTTKLGFMGCNLVSRLGML